MELLFDELFDWYPPHPTRQKANTVQSMVTNTDWIALAANLFITIPEPNVFASHVADMPRTIVFL